MLINYLFNINIDIDKVNLRPGAILVVPFVSFE
jgi:hypothetical protein